MQPAAAPLFSSNGNSNFKSGSGFLLVWRGGGRWRDTPQVRPCRLVHGIHAVDGPAICPLPASDNFPVTAVDPRHAWIRCIGKQEGVGSVFLRKTDPTPTHSARLLLLLLSLLLIFFFLFLRWRPQETVRGRAGGLAGGVSRMGPRHASGGLGRTPNPGLAVCAGQRTRASGCQASRDGFTASPEQPTRPAQSHDPASTNHHRRGGSARWPGNLNTPPPAHPCGSPTRRNTPRSRDHA